MRPYLVLGAAALSFAAMAQSADKAEVISAQMIQQQSTMLTDKAGQPGGTINLADYKAYTIKLSVLTTSGHAEAHAHFDDVSIVQSGTATVITGGTIVSAHSAAPGETVGPSIEGGTQLVLHAGDIARIPAGVPHQFLIEKGTMYKAFVIKVPRD